MNRWIFLLIIPLFAFTMIYDKHDTTQKVDDELNNVEDNKQDVSHRIFITTPTLGDLQDHEVVLVSSNNWSAVMWRDNVEIYAVKGSCVTVLR